MCTSFAHRKMLLKMLTYSMRAKLGVVLLFKNRLKYSNIHYKYMIHTCDGFQYIIFRVLNVGSDTFNLLLLVRIVRPQPDFLGA